MTDLIAQVAGLWRYPVKSCGGEAVSSLSIGADGWPAGDRGWAIVDASGELTWMGAHSRLALVCARLVEDALELQAEGRVLTVALQAGTEVTTRGWNAQTQTFDHLQAWDAGDDAAALLRATTGERLRLVRLSLQAQRRPVLNALHLVGNGSLQAWSDVLPQPAKHLTSRARPNVVLAAADGSELPAFIEDLVTEARIGNVTLQRTTACVRCVMTSVDPTTGTPQPHVFEGLARLSAARSPGSPVQFGIYALGSPGELHVGDHVELTLDFGAA